MALRDPGSPGPGSSLGGWWWGHQVPSLSLPWQEIGPFPGRGPKVKQAPKSYVRKKNMAHTMSQSQSPTHILVPMIICSELLVLCITTNDGSMFEVVLLWELKITRMAHMAYWFKQSFSTLKIYLISMDIRCTNYAISFRQTTSFLIIKQEYK